jgi:hypothetical protein
VELGFGVQVVLGQRFLVPLEPPRTHWFVRQAI